MAAAIIFHTECQVRYIAQALREMIERGYATHGGAAGRRTTSTTHRLDEKAQSMVWAHPGVTSWYKNARNRITVTSPWRLLDYWGMTRHFVPEDFRVAKPGHKPEVPGQGAAAVASADSLPVS